jgi:ubiquitin C-terminal hydrolase
MGLPHAPDTEKKKKKKKKDKRKQGILLVASQQTNKTNEETIEATTCALKKKTTKSKEKGGLKKRKEKGEKSIRKMHNDEDRINDFFSGRGRRGIINVGNTCFASSVLQLLAHCPAMLKAIIKVSRAQSQLLEGSKNQKPPERESSREGNQVVRSLADLFLQQLLGNKSDGLDPRPLLQALVGSRLCNAELKAQLARRMQTDAQEFLTSLVEAVTKEVSHKLEPAAFAQLWPELAVAKALDADAVPLQIFMDRAWIDSHDRMVSDFSNPEASIVHGQLLMETICGACGAKSPASDVFVTLTIDMCSPGNKFVGDQRPEARIDLADCLRQRFTTERLHNSGWKCSKCKETPDLAMRACSLWRLPRVILVCIKRFDPHNSWVGKKTTRVALPRHINLMGVVAEDRRAEHQQQGSCYRLLSVVNHFGAAHYGHYTATFRDSLLDEWFQCDDESVSKTQFKEIDEATSYIIAYERFTPRGG